MPKGDNLIKHGLSKTSEFTTWCGMIQRCRDTNRKDSKHYSLKGVRVCRRWKHFKNFLADMGNRPKPGMTLHRLDSQKRYGPGNVVWADWKTQNRQSDHARMVEINGDLKSISEWRETFGIPHHTFYNRIKRGWTEEDALTTPKSARIAGSKNK